MKFNVNKRRSLWWSISIVIILSGLLCMFLSWQRIGTPLRPSLDFVGGTRLQFELDCTKPNNCDKPITPEKIRDILAPKGLGSSSIQVLDKQQAFSIRSRTLSPDERVKLQADLEQNLGSFDSRKTQINTVGPTLGRQLFTSGMLALSLSYIGIIVYITFRYKLDFAVFAIIALFHDVLFTVGAFSFLGLVANLEVDNLFIVALLTLSGFSVNDTVVIYDRIREILTETPDRPIREVVDDAVNQTLFRSINTTFCVMLCLISLFLFGGETLKYFALALIVGFTSGAYSTIFIASTLLAWWRERTEVSSPGSGTLHSIETAITPDDA